MSVGGGVGFGCVSTICAKKRIAKRTIRVWRCENLKSITRDFEAKCNENEALDFENEDGTGCGGFKEELD